VYADTCQGHRCNHWPRAAILARVVFMGTLYFVLNVPAAKYMTLFCAWLNIQLASTDIWITCIIIIAVGLFMFAIPIIPGLL